MIKPTKHALVFVLMQRGPISGLKAIRLLGGNEEDFRPDINNLLEIVPCADYTQQIRWKAVTQEAKELSDTPNTDVDGDVDDVNVQSSSRTSVPRQHITKFVGRRIAHQWIIQEGKLEWYHGTVLAVIRGKDGEDDAVYDVQYDDEDDSFEVDHLTEDYKASQLKFSDI
ncbi:uncharacterized protein LOC117320145 [Pecten maximus]|uniref:uncharacterized protein LOC117320145 n=1 Tax=Pecten maximus TaxID=6579 RepID=UPI0014590C0B|nr:uncharacterized protein LOC117320145 [Pecten maximus]